MRRLVWAWCVLSAIALSAGVASAQTGNYSPEYRSCLGPAGADDDKRMACVKAETARQDKLLNEAYTRLQARLKTSQKEALTQSERAWIKFRDAECDFQGSVDIGGPLGIQVRASGDARADCILKQTQLRAAALKDSYAVSWDGTR